MLLKVRTPLGFDRYVGIDYSGRGTPGTPLRGLRVYASDRHMPEPSPVLPQHGGHWSRAGLADWIISQCNSGQRFLIGIDHAFSFPIDYFRRYGLHDWNGFLENFEEHWPTAEPGATVAALHAGNQRIGTRDEFRLTDKWTAGPKSVFLFGVPGQVATSTHAGIPWLQRIRQTVSDRVHFWPFDCWELPTGKSAIIDLSFPLSAALRTA
jgi:hypothetical protein